MATDDTRVDGWRLKLGRVAPTTSDYPNDLTRMLPDGVKVAAVTAGALSFDRSEMADARARRREAAEHLAEWGVDCVVAAGGPVSTLEGPDAEAAFVESVRAELDVPFTTSLTAQVDALAAVDAESLLVVTPFPEDRDAETRAFLEAHGFEVAAVGGPNLPNPGDTRDLPASASYQHAKRLARETDADFDTVYVGCSPFGSVEHVPQIEADLDCTALTSMQAQLWWAFRAGGIAPDMAEYGRLFEELSLREK
jgi:maleate isomerase